MKISGFQLKEIVHQDDDTKLYRAVHTADNRSCMIKILEKKNVPDPSIEKKLHQEFNFLKEIDSENVIEAIQWIDHLDFAGVVMADVSGAALLQTSLPHEPVNTAFFLNLAYRIADGLTAIHAQNIIHSYMSPINIFWNPDKQDVKIINFIGASKIQLKIGYLESATIMLENLPYISPEQTGRMNHTVDQRADLYSVGIIFYELATGQRPFNIEDPNEMIYAHLAREPKPPHSINPNIPPLISDMILKLMAKNPEDRYQSASGLRYDLEKLKSSGKTDFALGEKDISGIPRIPEKLYGRSEEIAQLLNAYKDVRNGGKALLMIAGYSGTGKTALVNEIHKPITRDKGYFINGKFDQLQRITPYAAFVQALNQFCRALLSEEQSALDRWREKILKAIGKSGKILTDMISQLEAVIGPQPDVPGVGGDDAKRRFNYVFQRFFEAISSKDHPLVIFIDDLQWADPASLNLFQILMENRQNNYLFFIGAYRDNEVSPVHPLMIALEAIQKQQIAVETILVKNLSLGNIQDWLADTLRIKKDADRKNVLELSKLIHQKTQGNAFFTIQFFENLFKENLLQFDHKQERWTWDLIEIQKENITDNVVELLSNKIENLSSSIHEVLKFAACIGNRFDIRTLNIISKRNVEYLEQTLEVAIMEQLLLPEHTGNYRFIHDRVHQAAYSLISEASRKSLHLEIGFLLLHDFETVEKTLTFADREEQLFNVVNHLNIGMTLIKDEEQKLALAKLNLRAGRHAKLSAAYKPGAQYIRNAIRLLPAAHWQSHYELALALYNEAVQIAYFCGDFVEMDSLVEIVLTSAHAIEDQSTAYEYRLLSLIAQNQPIEAIDALFSIFNTLGLNIPRHPSQEDGFAILAEVNEILTHRGIESIQKLSRMKEGEDQLVMRLFYIGAVAFIWAGTELIPAVVGHLMKMTLKKGISNETPYLLAFYAFVRLLMGDIVGAYQLSETALELMEKGIGNDEVKGRAVAFICIYTYGQKHHFHDVCQKMMDHYPVTLNVGDFEYAAYMLTNTIMCLSRTDTALGQVGEKAKFNLNGIVQLNQSVLTPPLTLEIAYNDALRGENTDPAALTLDLGQLFEGHQEGTIKLFTWQINIKNVILAYLFEEDTHLPRHLSDAEKNGTNLNVPMTYVISDTLFYFPLAYMRLYTLTSDPDEKKQYLDKAETGMETLKKWAEFGPVNFLHKYDLLQAEHFRVTNDNTAAAGFYEKAIETAYENKYINEAALANELAGKFYIQREQSRSASFFLSEARQCYRKWGSTAKVKHLENNYPKYLDSGVSATSTEKPGASSGATLDIRSIMKASQTLSGEVKIKNLLEKMMGILIENAGAQRTLLIKIQNDSLFIQAEGTTEGVTGLMHALPVEDSGKVPLSVIHLVARTKDELVFGNIGKADHYAKDPYIQTHQPKSVVCFPIMNKGELFAILYLENNLVEGAFTQARLEVLRILSAQIAISMENTELVERLEEKVKQRTGELRKAHEQIIVLEKEATEQQMAGGFAHEMRNALVGSQLVIEQALGYDKPEPHVSLSLANSRNLKETFIYLKERLPEEDLEQVLTILRKIFSNEEHVDEVLRVIYKSVSRGLSITQQIMDYARIGRETANGNVLHMDHLILDLVEGYQADFAGHGIEIEMDLASDNSRITGRESHFISIVSNLLLNARDAVLDASLPVNHPRKIGIFSVTTDRGYQFSVVDSGVGIAAEHQPRIFDAFFSTKPETGTGLGLGVVRKIISLYGGDIFVESESGQGATFKVKLPLAL